jgi:hypothetical protein
VTVRAEICTVWVLATWRFRIVGFSTILTSLEPGTPALFVGQMEAGATMSLRTATKAFRVPDLWVAGHCLVAPAVVRMGGGTWWADTRFRGAKCGGSFARGS